MMDRIEVAARALAGESADKISNYTDEPNWMAYRDQALRVLAALDAASFDHRLVPDLDSVLAVIDDFKSPQPEASEFAKGANFAARQIWSAVAELSPNRRQRREG